jgi:hypothetical protein
VNFPARQPGVVAASCEAFLDGRYVEHLLASHRRLPPWVALNRLAHADAAVIAALAAAPDRAAGADELPWVPDERDLARAIMAATRGEPGAVRALQLDALVRLELWLIERRRDAVPFTSVIVLARDAIASWTGSAATP